jgi:hypothetical protein
VLTYEQALDRLDRVREPKPGQATALCPAHHDKKRSLSVGKGVDGRLLLTCHADEGCTFEVILAALADDKSVASNGHTSNGHNGHGRQAKREREVRHNVVRRDFTLFDPTDGHVCGVHGREDFTNADGEPDKDMWWTRHDRPLEQMPLWNAPALKALRHGALVIVTEGELKAMRLQEALTAAGVEAVVVATVTGGKSTPCDVSLAVLRGYDVVLWPDNDRVGRTHMQRIASRLRAMGEQPRWVHWLDAPDKADAADFLLAGHTIAEIEPLIGDVPDEAEGGSGSSEAENPHNPGEHLSGSWDGGTLLSEVTPVAVEWLWGGYIPLGKLTIGDGDPGLGKTMLFAADLAARVTDSREMPDGSPGIPGGAGVVIFTAEDDPADTLQPRFVAAGGDLSRVLVVTTIHRPDTDPDAAPGTMIERLPTFADDALIERAIQRVHAKLVIFDPFMAYLPSAINSFRDQDVRSALAPLARLAQRTGAAFVLIRHLNKGTFANALYRGGGSIGIIGAARSGLLVVKDPDDENARIFGGTKSNLSKAMPSWKYRITENDQGVPHIQWEGESERSASELLSQSNERDTTSKLDAACEHLRDRLHAGAQPEKALMAELQVLGISKVTMRRAKDLLGVESKKHGIGTDGYWEWLLPSIPKDAHDAREGDHPSDDEHLSARPGIKPAQQAASPKGAHANGYEHLHGHDEHLTADEGDAEWTF